jgi:selenium metabolism protein YedF
MRIIDTRGQLCPAPLIAAKRALKETAEGESFILLTDNRTSFDNLCRYIKDNKANYQFTESGGTWTMTISRDSSGAELTNANEYNNTSVPHFEKGNFIVVITSDKMGDGDELLGKLLMTNFIIALKDLDKLPEKMVFYNGGVKLATISSPVIEHLKDLANMGVEIILCATCVSHYSLESLLGTGIVSNMYTIAGTMASAGSIVRP